MLSQGGASLDFHVKLNHEWLPGTDQNARISGLSMSEVKCTKDMTFAHFCKRFIAVSLMVAEVIVGLVFLSSDPHSSEPDYGAIWDYCLTVTLYFVIAVALVIGDLLVHHANHPHYKTVCRLYALGYVALAIWGLAVYFSSKVSHCNGPMNNCNNVVSLFQFLVFFMITSVALPVLVVCGPICNDSAPTVQLDAAAEQV